MKNLQLFLVFFCLSGMFLTTNAQTYYDLTGTVYYENSNSDPMDHTYVYLWNSTGTTIIDSVETDENGDYAFSVLSNTYKVSFAHTLVPFGGIDNTDVTMIMQHFVGQITLTGDYEKVADVTGNYVVNSGDALEVSERINKMITEYSGGKDWLDEKYPANCNDQNDDVDIYTLCFGDVDGSYSSWW